MKRSVASLAVILSAAVILGLLATPAALAQEKRELLKEFAQEKRVIVQEKAHEISEVVKEKVGEKRENVRDAAQVKKKEEIHREMEVLKEKRKTLMAKVASADSSKVEALDRARLKEISNLTHEQAKERLAKLKVVKVQEDFKVRPIAEAAKEAREKAFEQLKEDEKTLREKYKERLDSLKEAKEHMMKDCSNETQSGECTKIRADAVEKAKEAALKAVDRIVSHLQKLKEKLQSSENIPEAEAAERIAKIDTLISEVEAIKQKISAASTKKEINAAVKELKDAVKKVKRASEAHSQGLLRAEIHGVIQRSEVIEKKLDCALGGLEANGTDTAAVDAKIAELSSKMGAARDKLKTAKELLASDDDTKIAEGKNLIREARDLVRESHSMLEEIRKDIRELGGQPCQEEQEIAVDDEETEATSATPIAPAAEIPQISEPAENTAST